MTLPIASWLDVQAEGLYAMKGLWLNESGIKSSLQLDYLEVSVIARVRFAHRILWGGGPRWRSRFARARNFTFNDFTTELDVMDQVNRFDFGVAMGGGVEFGSIVVDGRYTLGLTDIDKDKSDTVTTKNRTISVTAGFRF